MGKFFMAVVVASCLFVAALGEYICGRIILPAVGLTAPEYWTWFWFMFWGLTFSSPFWLIKAALS